MSRMNWTRARRQREDTSTSNQRRLDRAADRLLSQKAAPLPKGQRRREVGIHWPVRITDGVKADGTLRVVMLKSREDADAKGYRWVGR